MTVHLSGPRTGPYSSPGTRLGS